jgi:hypothetical protein
MKLLRAADKLVEIVAHDNPPPASLAARETRLI